MCWTRCDKEHRRSIALTGYCRPDIQSPGYRPDDRSLRNWEEDLMPNLAKYTLAFDEKKDKWTLRNDRTNRVEQSFGTKARAMTGGVLKRAVGRDGGSVKIQKENGRLQEERTYPGRKNPRKSKG
jgi:hypothetical protein